jgi:hypothetical protein
MAGMESRAARHNILEFLRKTSPCCPSEHSGVFCATSRRAVSHDILE